GSHRWPQCRLCIFFFSGRRRHTRFSRDWSSDVCSSDLINSKKGDDDDSELHVTEKEFHFSVVGGELVHSGRNFSRRAANVSYRKIGRASCRERGEVSGGGVAMHETL